MKTANNILVLAALLAGMAAGWLGASAGGGAQRPERAGEGVEQVGPAEESITVRLDATNIVAAVGVASALVWLAARKRAKALGFSDEAAAGVAESIGAILDATSATAF